MNVSHYLVGIGTSHPNGWIYIEKAMRSLESAPNLQILAHSSVERSGGVGTEEPLVFLNMVLYISTSKSPISLWFELAALETRLGRIRTKINGPRTIDLDLLYRVSHNTNAFVTVPHPRFFERRFAFNLAMEALKNAGEDVLQLKIGSMFAPDRYSNHRT